MKESVEQLHKSTSHHSCIKEIIHLSMSCLLHIPGGQSWIRLNSKGTSYVMASVICNQSLLKMIWRKNTYILSIKILNPSMLKFVSWRFNDLLPVQCQWVNTFIFVFKWVKATEPDPEKIQMGWSKRKKWKRGRKEISEEESDCSRAVCIHLGSWCLLHDVRVSPQQRTDDCLQLGAMVSAQTERQREKEREKERLRH